MCVYRPIEITVADWLIVSLLQRYRRPCDEENGVPVESKVSLGLCFKKQLPCGVYVLSFWHWGISDEVIILLGPFPECWSLWHREQLLLFLERGPKPNCPRPRLALGPSLLPPHPLSPKTPLFVMENYTFTNCVSFLTPSIFPHRDRFWNDLMDESCRYPAVYRNCL